MEGANMSGFQGVVALLFGGMLFLSNTTAFARDEAEQSSVFGDETQDAKDLVNEAIGMFQSGEYSGAIEKFQEAYDVLEDPNILFNIARCYQEIGNKESAIDYYNRFLSHPDSPADAKARARERLKQLEGEDAGRTSGEAEGPDDSEPTGSPLQSSSGEDGANRDGAPTARSRSRVLEWSLISAGAVLAVTGAAFGSVALAKHNEFESSHDANKKEDLENTGRVMALTSDITLGVGIVSMATGLILLLARKPEKRNSGSQTSFVPAATRHSAELSWVVRF